MSTPQKIKKLVIAGGGTAGWMAGAAFSKLFGKTLDITLVESDAIGTVGVGEATIPTLLTFHRLLDINEQEFMAAVKGTFKLGIDFTNWRDENHSYIHSFGVTGHDHWSAGFQHFWMKGKELGLASDYGDYCLELKAALENKFSHLPNQGLNYAFHIDASLYAQFLRKMAESNGLVRQEGKIQSVQTNGESGFIESITLESGQVIEGDIFIDCTGFVGLLIEKTLKTGYDNWAHWLPCDSAVALQTASVSDPIPYTRSTARTAGWQWRIPLQHRVGNGQVFCSKFISDDEVIANLLENVEGEVLTEPRVLKFTTGSRRKHWNKNCIAVGLSSGFMEPLESTSIHLIQRSIVRLARMFPLTGIAQSDIDEFNEQTAFEMENIRDFIILHYKVTNRRDTPFWTHCATMDVPDTLKHRIDLFTETGRAFKKSDELFGENSWIQVMMGQGIEPKQYHPVANVMSVDEIEKFLGQIKNTVNRTVSQLPSHLSYIQSYCRAEAD